MLHFLILTFNLVFLDKAKLPWSKFYNSTKFGNSSHKKKYGLYLGNKIKKLGRVEIDIEQVASGKPSRHFFKLPKWLWSKPEGYR